MPKKSAQKVFKFKISLEQDLFDFIEQEAKDHHGKNRSAAIAAAIRDMKERDNGPFGPENALIGDAKQIFRKFNLEHEHDDKGVDWILPKLGLGVELKTRFSGGAGIERMIAAIAYSVGRGRCTEIVIVGSSTMTPDDARRFIDVASAFRHCPASFVKVDDLPAFLKKRLDKKP